MSKNNHQEEARKEMAQNKFIILRELILERYRSLYIVSTIAFAFLGISIFSLDSNLIRREFLVLLSFILSITVSLVSLGRYIFITRKGVTDISLRIHELPNLDLSRPLPIKPFKKDYWVEILYIILVIAVLIFTFGVVDFS